jgi:hypothetical protein
VPLCGRWGLAEVTVAGTTVCSPPPTAGKVDRLYGQLMEIHAISATQLEECTYWRRFDSTPSPVRAKTGRWGSNGRPSVTRIAPILPTGYFSQVLLWQPSP